MTLNKISKRYLYNVSASFPVPPLILLVTRPLAHLEEKDFL